MPLSVITTSVSSAKALDQRTSRRHPNLFLLLKREQLVTISNDYLPRVPLATPKLIFHLVFTASFSVAPDLFLRYSRQMRWVDRWLSEQIRPMTGGTQTQHYCNLMGDDEVVIITCVPTIPRNLIQIICNGRSGIKGIAHLLPGSCSERDSDMVCTELHFWKAHRLKVCKSVSMKNDEISFSYGSQFT